MRCPRRVWQVSYWHNRLNTNPAWAFPAGATNNSRSFPRLSTSYTSLVPTGRKATGWDGCVLLRGMGPYGM